MSTRLTSDDVRERFEAGRAAWPALPLPEGAFESHLARHASPRLPALERAADLWLACACAHAVKGAAATFERTHRATIERAAAKVNRASVDEATQCVLVRLLVADPPAMPRIADYAGRASLGAWLTTVTTRAALRLHRRRDDQPFDTLDGLAQRMTVEPELALAKTRHSRDLVEALRAAFDQLDDRQRLLLQLRHVHGWKLERMAEMYGVSRATMARMVTAAHVTLTQQTKHSLRQRLRLTPAEVESLVGVLRSCISLSQLWEPAQGA